MLRLLDDRFRVLTAGRRTALPRQRTLQATLDWSHGLLEAGDARVFRRLAVFAGGCTLGAACALAGDEELPGIAVADAIGRLAGKSLIVVDRSLAAPRYRPIETMRAYAQQKLFEADESQTLQRRHAEYYCGFFEPSHREFRGDTSDAALLSRYGGELDNVLRALDWAFGAGGDPLIGARLAADAGATLAFHGLFLDLARWSEIGLRAVEENAPPGIRDRLKAGGLIAALFIGASADAAGIVDEAQALADSSDWAARIGAHVVWGWASGALARQASLEEAIARLARQGLPAVSRAGCYGEFARILALRAAGADHAADHRALSQAAPARAHAMGGDQVVTNILAWGTTPQMDWESPHAAIGPARALLDRLLSHTGYRLVRISVAQLAGRFITALVQRSRPGDLDEARAVAQTIEQRSVRVAIHLYRASLAWLALGDGRARDCARILGLLDQGGLTGGLLAPERRALMARLTGDLDPETLDAALQDGAKLPWDEAFRTAISASPACAQTAPPLRTP